MWQRVEVEHPLFKKAPRGQRQTAHIDIDHRLYLVRRVVSPTVAYVEPLESDPREDRSTPFVCFVKGGGRAVYGEAEAKIPR